MLAKSPFFLSSVALLAIVLLASPSESGAATQPTQKTEPANSFQNGSGQTVNRAGINDTVPVTNPSADNLPQPLTNDNPPRSTVTNTNPTVPGGMISGPPRGTVTNTNPAVPGGTISGPPRSA